MLNTEKLNIFIASKSVIDFLISVSSFFYPETTILFVVVRKSLAILFKVWKSKLNFLDILQIKTEKCPSKSEFFSHILSLSLSNSKLI